MVNRRENPIDRLYEESPGNELEDRREKLRQAQLVEDRQKLLRQPEFVRVMADILDKGYCFHSVMTGNSQTYYKSGQQDYARMIFADLLEANENIALQLMSPKTKYRGIKVEESNVG